MITLKELDNGFTYIEIANEKAEAKVALQGAHVYHYQRNGEAPLLWRSEASTFEPGKAIRGGIPVCWPWFGTSPDPALPQHGFARTTLWNLIGANDSDPEETKIILRLQTSDETLSLWPHYFDLYLHITVSENLTLALTTINREKSAFELTSALHTYFAISRIEDVHIKGLDGKPYFDALSGTSHVQAGDITIDKEVDRVYQKADRQIKLVDIDRVITLENEGSDSLIIWNPWIEKCAGMSAMKPDSYMTMLCIETANAREDRQMVEAGEAHMLKAVIT